MIKIIPGERFNRLTIIREADKKGRSRQVVCRCDCGVEKSFRLSKVRGGETVSCGCFRREQIRKTRKSEGSRSHPLYMTWSSMKDRCYCKGNTNYPDYGGRGVEVCGRWRNSFLAFVNDVGEKPSKKHTIDRIDVEGNYGPENFRWATQKEQQRNKRSNNYIHFMGKKRCMSEWAEFFGVDRHWLAYRVKRYGQEVIFSRLIKEISI